MRRVQRVPISLIASAVAISTLAACGSNEGEGDSELVVWFPGNTEAEMELVQDSIVPAFEEEAGVDIEVTYVDWPDLGPKLNAAFAAGTAPDVIGHGVAATADLAANGRVLDLSEYLDQMDPTQREDMGSALPGGEVDGTPYMVPLMTTIRMIAYSAADFEAAGLDPEAPPETWEEVREVAEDLTERDGSEISRAGLVVPSDPIGVQQTFGTLLWSNGGEFISDDGNATMDTPEAIEALEFYASLYDGESAVDNTLGAQLPNQPAETPVVTGQAAMQLINAGDIIKLQEAGPDRDLRLMAPPAFDGAEPGAFGGPANGLMINADTAVPDLAWDFVSAMVEPETNLEYVEALGALPVHASSIDSDYISANPELQRAVEALPSAHPNPNVPGWTQMRDAMGQHLERALHGEVEPADALEQANTEVAGILASGS